MPRRDTLLVACVALALAAALFEATPTPDGERFARQAAELRAGLGFLWDGAPTTSLPPGYPVFLALLPQTTADARGVINVLLWTLGCALLHRTLRPAGRRPALLGALALAAHPWAARQVSYPMSEALALALIMLLMACLTSRGTLGAWSAGAAGLLASAAVLTAPALIGVAGGALALSTWRLRARPRALVALVFGAVALMLPWQLHCLRVAGHVEWLVVGRGGNFSAGRGLWARTFVLRESELRHVWHAEHIADAPSRAFGDAAERERLAALARASQPAALDAALAQAASARASPWRALAFDSARAVLLWSDMPALGHLQPSWVGRVSLATWRADVADVGARRAALRLAKGLACSAAQALYAAYALLLGWLAWRALRTRDGLALVVVAGTLLYTLVSAHTALGEARRNLPFIAAILALGALRRATVYAPARAIGDGLPKQQPPTLDRRDARL